MKKKKQDNDKIVSTTGRSTVLPAFSNHEIVTLAVYLLGGRSRRVDTEDVAIKSNELAPGRFSWRKYPLQVNLELIRVYLSDAKKKDKGGYLMGSGSDGWLLTQDGFEFSRKESKKLKTANLTRPVVGPKEKKWRRSERARMLASAALAKFRAEGPDVVTEQEACAFFRIDDYVVGKLREEKLARILNAFGDDHEIGEAVRQFAEKVRGTP